MLNIGGKVRFTVFLSKVPYNTLQNIQSLEILCKIDTKKLKHTKICSAQKIDADVNNTIRSIMSTAYNKSLAESRTTVCPFFPLSSLVVHVSCKNCILWPAIVLLSTGEIFCFSCFSGKHTLQSFVINSRKIHYTLKTLAKKTYFIVSFYWTSV